MAYPYADKVYKKACEVHIIHKAVTATTGTTTTQVCNFPPGTHHITICATAYGTPAVATFKPYCDRAQTITNGALKVLPTGSTTALTNLTLAATATGTVGNVVSLLPSGDQYGLAAECCAPFGGVLTITQTHAGRATYHIMSTGV
jgi:hypothetical protein